MTGGLILRRSVNVMTKSVSVGIYITCLFYLLQPVCTGITYTSKACYGTGRHCIRHDINYSDTQKIAIVDAYFTNNTECGQSGLVDWNTVNPDSVTERGYHRFSINEVFSLYKSCSRKRQCWYRAPRRVDAYIFSVVKYRCIESTNRGSIVDNVFSTKDITSSGGITTRPNKDELPIPTSSRFQPGVFMGGVAAGAVMVILVYLAVYVLVIRRRYDLTVKKQGDTLASVEHPTYSGLSAGGDVNNYTSIEHTSRSQEDTEHGSAAIPDFQNM